MVVKARYKQTEVGTIPEDWQVRSIDQVVSVCGGGTPSTNVKDFWEGNVNWFTPTEVGFQKYLQESQRKLTIYGLNNSSAKILQPGTILMTSRAGIGDLGILKIEAATNQGFQSLITNSSINNEFLYYLMLTKKNELLKNASGSTFLEISPTQLKSIKIALPPLKEQAAIATTLGDVDILIDNLEKLIDKKRKIKQGAMQQLLKPKRDWIEKKLGDFLDYEQPTDYLVSDTEYDDFNQTPVLTAGKTFILGYTNEIHGIFNKLPVIIFDDFTTSIKYVTFPFKAKSSAMKMLIPKNSNVNLRFIFELMLQIKYQPGDHKRHWIGEYRQKEIMVPSSEKEQNEISTILTDMDNEIDLLEKKLSKSKLIKQGMMQDLLTGKIRLV